MIKSVDIKNFQSHTNSHLEFSKGVNVIVGSSDSGKTAIIRALKWVVLNRPNGDAFRNWSALDSDTKVSVTTFDGITVDRTRGVKKNNYTLGKSEFNAISTDVPKEIEDSLSINDINLQQQLDSPYLLSSSPGEVAQHFNKIAHLDAIDSGLKKIESAIRALKQEEKANRARVDLLQEEADRYNFLEKMEIDIDVLESVETTYKQTVSNVSKLGVLIDSIINTTKFVEVENDVAKMQEPLDKVLANIELLALKNKDIKSLLKLYESIQLKEEECLQYEEFIKVDLTLDSLLTLMNRHDTLQKDITNLDSLMIRIASVCTSIESGDKLVKALEQKFHQEMPDECPLCGHTKYNINSL